MYDIYDNEFDKKFDEAVDAIEKKEHRRRNTGRGGLDAVAGTVQMG